MPKKALEGEILTKRLFWQLYILSNGTIQTALLRDAYEHQIRDADRCASQQYEECFASDICESLCGIWWEKLLQYSRMQMLIYCVVVKNPLSPVEHPGGDGVANELFELALDQFVTGVL